MVPLKLFTHVTTISNKTPKVLKSVCSCDRDDSFPQRTQSEINFLGILTQQIPSYNPKRQSCCFPLCVVRGTEGLKAPNPILHFHETSLNVRWDKNLPWFGQE